MCGVCRYEAFESMARKEMHKVCACMRLHHTANGGIAKVAIVHRTGVCPVGEPSVVVACSSPHRREALEAAACAALLAMTSISTPAAASTASATSRAAAAHQGR